jgi:hypothetical protein
MRTVMVRYKVKADRAAENQRYVEAVFRELATTAPAGLHYATFKQPDGLTFVHVASIETPENPLQKTAAFQAFTEHIEDRCDEPPVTTVLEEVGSYAFHGSR